MEAIQKKMRLLSNQLLDKENETERLEEIIICKNKEFAIIIASIHFHYTCSIKVQNSRKRSAA